MFHIKFLVLSPTYRRCTMARLITTYRNYACTLMATGRGLQEGRILDDDSLEGTPEAGDGSKVAWIASVPCDGPDHDTSELARNEWGA